MIPADTQALHTAAQSARPPVEPKPGRRCDAGGIEHHGADLLGLIADQVPERAPATKSVAIPYGCRPMGSLPTTEQVCSHRRDVGLLVGSIVLWQGRPTQFQAQTLSEEG